MNEGCIMHLRVSHRICRDFSQLSKTDNEEMGHGEPDLHESFNL